MSTNHLLRHARLERGWSQAVVAAHLETSTKNVSRWESGNIRPSPYFRAKLCQLFGTTAHALGFIDSPAASPVSVRSENAATSQQPLPQADLAFPSLSFTPTHVVGRDVLLEHLLTALCSGRTCALHGLPGVGKTTLAQVVAQHETIQKHFPDGVLWVGLGPSPDVSNTLTHWATVLSVPEDAMHAAQTAEAIQTLVRQALSLRRVLLVIDDAWTSEAALPFLLGGSLCAHLLTTRFPQVALLVTEEAPFLVSELDEQETTHLLTSLVPSLAQGNALSLHEVFRMTGGLPLAVTLIGKYLRLHAYSGQPRRLHAALTSLTDAHTRLQLTLPPSNIHRIGGISSSLHAVIALSDEQLSPTAREALYALSVLPAKPERFSEAAALAVCQQDALVLDQLSDAGLLESAGPGWYRLHQTIADYAQLHRQGQAPLHHLVQYACDLCRTHRTNITLLDQEYATLLTALEVAVQHDWFEARLLLVEGLSLIWRVRHRSLLAEQHVQQALEQARVIHDRRGIIRMLYEWASIARSRGDYEQVEAILQQAMPLAHEEENTDLLQQGLMSLGDIAFHIRGDVETADSYWQEALRLLGKHNMREQRLRLLSSLGMVAGMRQEREQAEQYFLEVLTEVKSMQHPEQECMTLLNLGYLYVNVQGKQAKAEDYYQQALAVTVQYRLEEKGCLARVVLGEQARRRGDIEEAERLLHEALVVARPLEDPLTLAEVLDGFALVKIEQGKETEAKQYVQEALALVTNIPNAMTAIRGTWGLLLLHQHQWEAAAHQYNLALEEVPKGQETTRAEHLYGLAQVRAGQGDRLMARRLGRQSLSLMEAAQYWKTDEVRQWLEQQDTQYPSQTGKATHQPPQESLHITQSPPGQCEAPSKMGGEISLHEEVTCPACAHTQHPVKHSRNRSGSQRYQCTFCGEVFTPFPKQKGKDVQDKMLAQQLAARGMSQRAIGRQLGVHHSTIRTWLTKTPLS